MSHFYLTLPSNSSHHYYPNNTVAQFTTRLQKTIDLSGEWEVGLTEMMFPRSWPNVDGTNSIEVHATNCLETDPPHDPVGVLPYDVQMRLTPGYYDSMEALIKGMNDQIHRTFSKPIPTRGLLNRDYRVALAARPKFFYNNLTRRVSAKVPGFAHITFDKKLADILGYPVDGVYNEILNPQAKMIKAPRASDMEGGLHAVYVYCDLLESVPVGDTSAPLLAILASDGKHGETVIKYFEKPRYIPLQKKLFDSAEILIKDAYGNNVAFESGRSTVTLHFRRVKESYFLG